MEKNISKYVDFYLVKGVSKKNNKEYYCISMKINDKLIPLAFLTQTTYDYINSLN